MLTPLDTLYSIYSAVRLAQDAIMDFDGWEHEGPLSAASDLGVEVAAEIMRSEGPETVSDVRRIASTPGLPLNSFNGCFDLDLFESGLHCLIDIHLVDLHALLAGDSDIIEAIIEYELIDSPAELVEYLQGAHERQAYIQADIKRALDALCRSEEHSILWRDRPI